MSVLWELDCRRREAEGGDGVLEEVREEVREELIREEEESVEEVGLSLLCLDSTQYLMLSVNSE